MASTATRTRNRSIPERISDLPFVLFGAGDVAVEQARAVPQRIDAARGELAAMPDRLMQRFDDLAERGRVLSNRIERDPKVKEARAQTRTAQSKVKGAKTSVERAGQAQTKAARSTARKMG